MAEKPVNTLAKSERICGKKSIEALLAGGSWGNAGALKYCWRAREEGVAEVENGEVEGGAVEDGVGTGGVEAKAVKGPRMMVSVSKRLFKRAVRRNLLKRRIREAYRLQKSILGRADVDIMFVYSTKEIVSFEGILAAVGQILAEVCDRVQSGTKRAGFVPKNQCK